MNGVNGGSSVNGSGAPTSLVRARVFGDVMAGCIACGPGRHGACGVRVAAQLARSGDTALLLARRARAVHDWVLEPALGDAASQPVISLQA